jgi:hypothetical protein
MKSPYCLYIPLVARQRVGRHVPAATNTDVSCFVKYFIGFLIFYWLFCVSCYP